VDGTSQRPHVGRRWVAVGVMSEILLSSITDASESLGLSPFFVGVIIVAVVGNAAEHWVAVYFAQKNKIGLAVNIAVGSGAQIALFVAPVLCSLRSSSVRSRWHWSSTGSRSARSSLQSSSRSRSPSAESPRGTKACNCSPFMPYWG
jgi:Ca2+/Na+ antiporter